MIKLGDFNTMKVARKVDFGVYLDGGRAGDILLPKSQVPPGVKIGEQLDVFVYLDQEERPVATMERPKARVGDFAFLQCSWVNQYGAFLNWGLQKDLFCPFREQKKRMEVGRGYIVHVHIDEESYRIMASAKVEHFLTTTPPPYHTGDEVALLVWQKTTLGFKVIVDNQYAGMVFQDQVSGDIHTGDELTGYIRMVREDGKIDVNLHPIGHQQALDFAEILLDYLRSHDGHCDLGDKSDAEEIKERFNVSKKTFKRAVGDLYKRRLVTPGDKGIDLV